ncbi:MAG TPA: family 20 glycosylhydrolase [Candidatus Didemnitutus sp.]|nr:family 20 glycosylhydrolase [Candidatus Didemnitutus sp.]
MKRFLRIAGLILLLASTSLGAHELMPAPAAITPGSGRLDVDAALGVAIDRPEDMRLRTAVTRWTDSIHRRTGIAVATARGMEVVEIKTAANSPELPKLGDEERYTLTIDAHGATLTAATTTGALRGLATLTQLLQKDERGWFFPAVTIEDSPRFPWRGLMIDVCRHWQPEEVILRNLDAMALVKLNVLHLHLTENQGFRIESKRFPKLQELGSDGHYFTQEQIREIIAYAADRGIRVVPEFDLPGHATSWLVAYPELASAPGPYTIERHWGVFDPVFDPTNPKVYELLDGFLGEMAALFPDEYLHVGGDENNGVDWNANAHIQKFIREHGLKNNEGLQTYFNGKLQVILAKYGKKMIGWDEILQPGLPEGTMIQSWRGQTGLADAVNHGYPAILSNGYYIDLNYSAEQHYRNDPLPANSVIPAAARHLVYGGEATMWAEWVTPDTIDTRIWPRTAAIAERLWSPGSVNDVEDMYRRLAIVDQRLAEAGAQQDNNSRIHAPGIDPKSATGGALVTLASLVQPVTHYKRGGLQPDVTQLNPSNDLADWCKPESLEVRSFNVAVDDWLFAPGALDADRATRFKTQLMAWAKAADLVAKAPAADAPIAQGRISSARTVVALADAGEACIDAMLASQPLTAEKKAAIASAIAVADKPTAAAVVFPMTSSIRLLLAAAAEPAKRDQLARDAWKAHLIATEIPLPKEKE